MRSLKTHKYLSNKIYNFELTIIKNVIKYSVNIGSINKQHG